jgi:hypothetical protein
MKYKLVVVKYGQLVKPRGGSFEHRPFLADTGGFLF